MSCADWMNLKSAYILCYISYTNVQKLPICQRGVCLRTYSRMICKHFPLSFMTCDVSCQVLKKLNFTPLVPPPPQKKKKLIGNTVPRMSCFGESNTLYMFCSLLLGSRVLGSPSRRTWMLGRCTMTVPSLRLRSCLASGTSLSGCSRN